MCWISGTILTGKTKLDTKLHFHHRHTMFVKKNEYQNFYCCILTMVFLPQKKTIIPFLNKQLPWAIDYMSIYTGA